MTADSAEPVDGFRQRLRSELGLDAKKSDNCGPDAVDLAVEAVRSYCSDGYTGAAFDTYGTNDCDRITSDDLIALSMLSIHIKESSTSSLRPSSILTLESLEDRVTELLGAVPADRELHTLTPNEFDRWLGPGSPGDELYQLLRKEVSIPRVAVYKLLARKRLTLMPIRDTVVERALGRTRGEWWRPWWQTLSADLEVVDRMDQIRRTAEASHLSLLRIADIVIWMTHRP